VSPFVEHRENGDLQRKGCHSLCPTVWLISSVRLDLNTQEEWVESTYGLRAWQEAHLLIFSFVSLRVLSSRDRHPDL
jgi:hypothetical protein